MSGETWIDRDGYYKPSARMLVWIGVAMFVVGGVAMSVQAIAKREYFTFFILAPWLAFGWMGFAVPAWTGRESLNVLKLYVAIWGWSDKPAVERLKLRAM